MMVIHRLHCIPKDALQLPLFRPPPPPQPPPLLPHLLFHLARSLSSRIPRLPPHLAESLSTAIHSQPSPPGTASGVQDEQAWHSPIMFSFFSPASPVVVTSLTSPLKFFISHFTFRVAHSHCLSLPSRLGTALGNGGGKGAIYSIWPF